ncbi:DoxX family protein [Pseudonocardia bannensis]|uniref:DoxX family protein n=1 Tax=Pseudonocardia bannensis TaxID=630973 RepID=A0A848DCU4_9PSEU|nr:DoxX family protein [Pseudonocardia bannensis]NMH90421.1 DoxX family protein [Pseudonocardia bannensis]
MTRSLPGPSRDAALLVARLVLGVVLIAHGWQKLVINGISGTAEVFHNFGIPLAILATSFTVVVELVGGAMLIFGVLVPVASSFIMVVMVGAIGFVHAPHGIFASKGGWELVAVIAAGILALSATGPGRYSIEHLLRSRKPEVPAPVVVPEQITTSPFLVQGR